MKNIKSNSNRIDGGVKDQLVCYLMIVPFAAMFMLFLALPIITSFFLSFFEFDMVSIPKFIGFSNYFRILFDDEVFMTTLTKLNEP